MKTIKILTIVAVALAIPGLFVGNSLIAQDKPDNAQQQQTTRTMVQSQTQLNSDGTPMGRGMHYIDENGNGICDRFEQGGQHMQQNAGHRMGRGMNSMDENGNGMCGQGQRGSGRMHNGRGHGNGGNGPSSMNGGWR